jgi:hypothetical protein
MTPDRMCVLLLERQRYGGRLSASQMAFLSATPEEREAYLALADPHASVTDGRADNREPRPGAANDGGYGGYYDGSNYAATRDDYVE